METWLQECMTTPYPAPLRVLIADDQSDVLEALRLLLKREGYQIEAVSAPAAILEALKRQNFDILLMDLNYTRDTTSGREGLDLLSRVQSLDSMLPIVVMTAWGSIDLAVEAMQRGVGDFVQKPWDNARLLATLRTQIQQGQARRKARRLETEKEIFRRAAREATSLEGLLKHAAEHIQNALRSGAVALFSRTPGEPFFAAVAGVGIPDENLRRLRFEPDSPLLGMMNTILDVRAGNGPPDEMGKLKNAYSALLVPIRLNGHLLAFISVGDSPSDADYNAEDLEFLTAIAEQTAAGLHELEFRQQEQDLEEGKAIQQGFLPKAVPQIPGYQISGAWQPARGVGGDYMDVLKFSESRIALCIADVVGKGMPAALLMSNLQAAVKACASEAVAPRALCEKINRIIFSNMAAGKFITLFYGLLDAASGRLAYTNAGHNAPAILRRDGSHVRLQKGGAALGVFSDWNYEQEEVELASGDRVILFTDGISEAHNSEVEEFGEERLIALARENRGLSAVELQKRILDTVTAISGGAFQDDATLIVVAVE